MTLKLAVARSIIAAAQERAAQLKLKPLTIVVLDAGGHLLAAERQDGSSIRRYDIAHGKAYGALALGMGSRSIMERAEQQPYFVAAAAAAIGGHLIPVPGGVLVQDASGSVIGAVGVSGDTSDNDEAAAVVGVESVELIAAVT